MFLKSIKFLVSLLGIVVLSGCATLFSGGSTDIRINSEPEDASVYIDGIQRGVNTPTTITLDHSYSDVWNDRRITLRLKGHEDRTFKIDHGISGWYWANGLVTLGGSVASYLIIGGTGTTETYDSPGAASDDLEAYYLVSGGSALAGALGSIIDIVTGSWVSVDKTRYRVELRQGVSNAGSNQNGMSYADYLHLSLDNLERGKNGAYLVPEHEKPLAVYDTESNKTIIFRVE